MDNNFHTLNKKDKLQIIKQVAEQQNLQYFAVERELISFIDTLLKDIKRYKILPKYTLRQLKLSSKESRFDELITNIKDLRRRLGDDYLNVILS